MRRKTQMIVVGFILLFLGVAGGYLLRTMTEDDTTEKNDSLTIASDLQEALFDAIAYNDLLKTKRIIKANPELLNKPNKIMPITPLAMASLQGRIQLVGFLLDSGATLNDNHNNSGTALLYACIGNHHEIIEMLISKGSDVNAIGPQDTTPLMASASNGNIESVKLLLVKGADVHAVDSFGKNPADYATKNYDKIMELMEEKPSEE